MPHISACFDTSLAEWPRLEGESTDDARFRRAVDACPNGVLYVPAGVYELKKSLEIRNLCSLLLHKSAILRAMAPMNFLVVCNTEAAHRRELRTESFQEDYNLFIRGGQFDGNGLASCLMLTEYHHFTLADTTLLNGKVYGLRVDDYGHGYELVASNVYCKCTIPGLAGNVAVSTQGGDSHYTDCIVVDYTVGFELLPGNGANRLTRCHVWGGPLPADQPDGVREMLRNSVNFRIMDGGSILRDCYADSGQIGFEIGAEVRLLGCSYFNNPVFGLDNITIFKHEKGRLLVADGRFTNTVRHLTVYEGCGDVIWRDNYYCGFPEDAIIPEYGNKS